MTHAYKRRSVLYVLLWPLIFPGLCLAAQQQAEVINSQPAAQTSPMCEPEPAVASQLNDAEAALLRIFLGSGDTQAKIQAAVSDAYAVITFPHVAKVGFFVTAAQGKGLLSYRESDGHWSYPIVVSARVTSVGPHFSMQTIDMMIVAKTHEALMRLLAGGAPAQEAQKQNLGAQLVTYSSNFGLTAGLSLDDYRITIDQEANHGLYCQPILAEDLSREGHKMTFKPPPCAQKFAQTLNRVSGRAPIIRSY